jgi:RNA polymerase sigma-70 factor, ECF subfamily
MKLLEQQAELLEQFARGDLNAFEALFREFQGQVYRWIVRLIRDRSIAEDLTIETFWRIYRAHARFDPKRSFGAWARRIATNAALDYLKSSRPEIALAGDFPALMSAHPAIQRDISDYTQRAFAALPPTLRVTAMLALIEEQTHQEIADALGISVGAVKLRVFRATRLLRKKLKEMGIEP